MRPEGEARRAVAEIRRDNDASPDRVGLEIAGRVLVSGKPARHDVVLESDDGETLAETPSDSTGEFRFPKLRPGDYRLRARTVRGTFPAKGLMVVLKRQSVTDVVLSDSNTAAPATSKHRRRGLQRRFRRNALLLAFVALTGAGAAWSWKMGLLRHGTPKATARLEASTDQRNRDPARASTEAARPPGGESAQRERIASETGAPSANARGIVALAAPLVSPAPTAGSSVSAAESLAASRPEPVRESAINVAVENSSGTPTAVAAVPVASTPVAASSEDVAASTVAAMRNSSRESRSNDFVSSAGPDVASSARRESDLRFPSSSGEARVPPAPLSRTMRVRLSPWRTRVLVDAILPTQPVRAGESETVDIMRNRLLAEQEARLPETFREPAARTGVGLVLPAVYPRELLSWVDSAGVVVADATVIEGCAEISWPAASAEVEQTFRLQRRDGSVVAEVGIEPRSRDFTVRTTDDIRTWLRLAIRVAPVDAVHAANRDQQAPRFLWRLASDATMPLTWQAGTTDAAGVEHHVKIPLGSVAGAVSFQGCTLIDHDSGWAIVSDVRQAADRPLGQ